MRKTVVALVSAAFLAPVGYAGPVAADGLWSRLYPQACATQAKTGAVIGGLLGAFVGNQTSSDRHRDRNTGLAGLAGAVAGSQVAQINCKKQLRMALIQQALETNQMAEAPAGESHPAMYAVPVRTYVNEARQTCRVINASAADDGSANNAPVTACQQAAGAPWVVQG